MPIAPEDKHDEVQGPEATNEEVDLELNLPDEETLPIRSKVQSSRQQKKNYDIKDPLTRAATEEELEKFDIDGVSLLPDAASSVDKDLESTDMNSVDMTEEVAQWYRSLVKGFESTPAKGVFEQTLSDPNANWKNSLSFNGQNINVGRPRFTNKGKGSSRMSSERLSLSIRSQLGLGAPVQVPLPASGFYVTVKPLGEDEIIELWREVIAETTRLGRVTHGLMFSNNQVFTAKAVVQSFLRATVETTVSDLDLDNFIDHVTVNDLPAICQSMATAIYPNGFPLTRSVFTADSNLPKEEISQIIDIRKSLMMNESMFNDAQLSHMAKRIQQPMTLKSIKEYKDAFVFNQNSIVEINEDIKLHLRTPTLRQWFEAGEKWINEINGIVGQALSSDADEKKRAQYVSQLARASRLRQYSHYVESVEEYGELHTTRENVDRILKDLSASNEISKVFYKAVSDFINNTQVSVIATTSVNEYEDTLGGEKWPRLIPIDAVSVFFQLVEQKLAGISSRALEDTLD